MKIDLDCSSGNFLERSKNEKNNDKENSINFLPNIVNDIDINQNEEKIETIQENEENDLVYIKKTREIHITDIIEQAIPEGKVRENNESRTIIEKTEKTEYHHKDTYARKNSIFDRFYFLFSKFIDDSYPMKIDKIDRLRGKSIKYPKLVIPVKSKFRLIWDVILTMIILLSCIYIPLQIAFPELNTEDSFDYEILVVVFFFVDIIFNLRTTYFNEDNEEVINTKLIATKYLKSFSFAIDLVSTIPISNFFPNSNDKNIKVINLFKTVRLLRLNRLLKYLRDDSLKIFYKIFTYFGALIILIHWLTCIWYSYAFSSIHNSSTDADIWIPTNVRITKLDPYNQRELLNKFYFTSPKTERYCYTLYSMIIIILGSDIGPASPFQAFWASSISVVGSITLAVLFGKNKKKQN